MTDNVSGNYEALAALLGDRPGWRPIEEDGERGWAFGQAGASRLTIVPEMDGFLVCIHDRVGDRDPRPSWVIPRIESVGEWLDGHEAEHAGLTPLQEEFRRALEEMQARGQDEEGGGGSGGG